MPSFIILAGTSVRGRVVRLFDPAADRALAASRFYEEMRRLTASR